MNLARKSVTATTAALMVAVALPAAGLSSAPSNPAIASGVLRDAGGRPAAGRVVLFHDNLRDHDRLEPIATAVANARGEFVLAAPPNARMRAAALVNDGYTNFAAFATLRDGVSGLRFFSARQAPSGVWLDSDSAAIEVALAADHEPPSADFAEQLEEAVEPIEASARRQVGVALASPWLDDCYYTLLKTFDRQTAVMELHTWYSDLSGKASYAKSFIADSEVTVGVKLKAGDASFGWDGTTHVGNELTAANTLTRTGKFGWVLSSEFRYKHWRKQEPNNFICGAAPYEIIENVRWNGGGLIPLWNDGRFDGQCTSTWNANKMALSSQATWSRYNNNLTWFQHSVSLSAYVGKFDVKSKSGASTKVGFEYATGTGRSLYYLCGNNDKPAFALRILAGH